MKTAHLSGNFKNTVVFCICLLCIFLFIYTGYSKIADHARFLKGLKRVTVIGPHALFISWSVPITEIIISVLLIIPKTMRLGLYSFTILMSLFTIYIMSMVLWATKLPCHCGGAIEKLSWTQHIWFNLVFIAIAVYALLLSKFKTSLKN